MGRDAHERSAAARGVFAEADRALGEPLSRLCFEGPDDQLVLTENTQPALVATSAALLAALEERLGRMPTVAFAAGHSLGEYGALVAAGALSLADAVSLVRVRGRAMQRAVPPGAGAMAAVMGLTPAEVEAVCAAAAEGDVVSPANFNGGQIVIAGEAAAVARASRLATERRAKVIPLKVSAPFHSALMRPAAEAVRERLATIEVRPLAFPVVSNVDARPNSDPARVRELLVRQIDGVVRWEESVKLLAESGVTLALEVGPGKVLANLVKRIAPGIRVLPLGDYAAVEAAAAEL